MNHAQASNFEQARHPLRVPWKDQKGTPPLVSVVIPCYNQARFLREAIESVLAQSHPNFEIIVVDDGSTDDTSEVAGGYPKVRLLRQENQGLAAARNSGLARSEGEYVVFLDADDRLLPEALEVSAGYLNVRPECAFVSGRYRVIAADGSPLPPRRKQRYVEKDHYLELLADNYVGPPVVVMYRRAVFESVGGFDTSVSPSADHEMSLRIAGRFPVGCHREVVAEYRWHGTNMSGNPARMLKSSQTVRRSYRKHTKGNKKYEEAIKIGIKRSQVNYGGQLISEVRTHLQEREWKRALRGLLVLLRYDPRALLGKRHIKRRKLALQLQLRKQELEVHEQRLKELESAQEAESAVTEERQEVQELRRHIGEIERRIQNLTWRARIGGRNGKVWKLMKKLRRNRAGVVRRLRRW